MSILTGPAIRAARRAPGRQAHPAARGTPGRLPPVRRRGGPAPRGARPLLLPAVWVLPHARAEEAGSVKLTDCRAWLAGLEAAVGQIAAGYTRACRDSDRDRAKGYTPELGLAWLNAGRPAARPSRAAPPQPAPAGGRSWEPAIDSRKILAAGGAK